MDQELYNIPHIQQQLMELHTLYEMGEISEEAYAEQEQDLLNRYKIAKEKEKNEL